MLDMGFIRDIRKILALLPKNRQNLLFSATFSDDIRQLAKGLVHDPVEVSVSPRNTTAETVKQSIYITDKRKKAPLLVNLIKEHNWSQVLIFARTKHGANRLSAHLEKQGINSAAIHGNKSQGARTKALAGFKNGEIQALVATDIAARGIDIAHLPFVVNFDLPHVAEDYVHRIGRTGRAGAVGEAVSLVCDDETKELFAIERLTQALLPRIEHPDYKAVNPVPESRLNAKPIKAKKPKKPRNFGNKESANAKDEHSDGQRSGAKRRGNKPVSKNPRHKQDRKPGGANQNRGRSSAPAKSPN
jgi:ATP-dependent RNA helicase RhlE